MRLQKQYYMKRFFVLVCLLYSVVVYGQRTRPLPIHRDGKCGLVNPKGRYMLNAQGFLDSIRQGTQSKVLLTTPYLIKIFVRIFRDNSGNNAATTRDSVINRVTQMNGQYSSDNVCFLLMGIDEINDSYANFQMRDDDSLDAVYKPYLRNNYALPGVVTIFIHDLFVSSGSSGNAYDIPNYFLSIAGWAANSAIVNSIYGHEMGHCLGLYHTFQSRRNSNNQTVRENVTRATSNSCYNCSTEGDLCCDTPADHPDADDNVSGTTCIYNDNLQDGCNVALDPSTRNIMSYMPWECISTTGSAVTSNQATRIHATINDAGGPIDGRIAPDNQTIASNETQSSGWFLRGVRNDLTYNASSIVHQSSVQSYNAAGNSITLNPGVHFKPAGNGVVELRIHPVCQ
jgi:hypothetical protein